MLEKPNISEKVLITLLQEAYGLHTSLLTFLPLGADINTAVYRAETTEGAAYFVKLRKSGFDEITVSLPHFLHTQGLQAIIAPLETTAQQLSASLDEYQLILYPFIEGENGYAQYPTDRQWLDFGATLKAVHTAQLPPALSQRIPQETFSPHGRELVRVFQAEVESRIFDEPVAARLAAFMQKKRTDISQVVDRAGQLALELQKRPLEMVLCHADIHPGNLHLSPDGDWYLVDWDNPILAPKERDLVLIGGCTVWSSPRHETLFYQGYGNTKVDRTALAYYRYERIVQDFAAFCEQLLLSDAGSEDREQSFYYFTTNFLPGHEIELARRIDHD